MTVADAVIIMTTTMRSNGHACGYTIITTMRSRFVSWGVETTKKFTKEEIHASLCALDDAEKYGTVLRAKGIVPAVDGSWIHFDYVPASLMSAPAAPM